MTEAQITNGRAGDSLRSAPNADINSLPVHLQLSLLERLLAKTAKDDTTGCWNWTGRRCGSGYGMIGTGRRAQLMPHRVSHLFFKGPITAPVVRHECDNRLCLNPDHLVLGTHRENTADMIRRGRHVSGMAKRAVCPKGHPYDRINANGARTCSKCMAAANLRHRQKRAAK